MLKTEFYQAQPIEAVQVNADNKQQIAEWTNGRVKTSSDGRETLLVPIGKLPKQKFVPARDGSWVILEATGSFRVFYEKVFPRIFTPICLCTCGEG